MARKQKSEQRRLENILGGENAAEGGTGLNCIITTPSKKSPFPRQRESSHNSQKASGAAAVGGRSWGGGPRRCRHLVGTARAGAAQAVRRAAAPGASAVIGAGGRTLHSAFTGAPPGHAEYPSAEVPETGQALVVLPGERHPGPPGWVTAIGCGQAVTVRLARPPGERVLIDLDASNGDGPPG